MSSSDWRDNLSECHLYEVSNVEDGNDVHINLVAVLDFIEMQHARDRYRYRRVMLQYTAVSHTTLCSNSSISMK